jgi:ribonucleoside-diphosphate reductase beta chain
MTKQELETEYILQPESNRYCLFNEKGDLPYQDLWAYYTQHKAAFWTPEEIDFAKDLIDWEKLSDDDRYFIESVLSFFAISDSVVINNLSLNFLREVQIPEASMFYGFQNMMEGIHAHSYSLMIDVLVKDPAKRAKLFTAFDNHPAVKAKADWAIKWIKSESFIERLVAFSVVEGIFFQGSFCALFWLKKRGLMPGLAFANQLISIDEALHADFAITLYNNHVQNKLTNEKILQIVLEGFEAEKHFILEALPVRLIGMNQDLMKQYLEYVVDTHLEKLGCPRHFNSQNPFDFMKNIALEGKTNFFEKRVSEYQKAGVMSGEKATFALTEDF